VAVISLSITTIGAEALSAKLGQLAPKAIEIGLEDAAEYTQLQMQTYPSQKSVPMEWVSEKQRRYVMAAIRDGRIQVPRARTYNLQSSWTKSISGYTATIQAGASYAHWVQGEDQARMMSKIGWQTTKEFVSNKASQVFHMFELGVRRAIAMLGL
jgi:hypothetical protein